jgi:VanZ family protein
VGWRRGPRALLSWRVEASILAIFSTAIVASCDEFHQTFLPGRNGSPVDVLLDTAGACTLCLMVWLVCWNGRAREEAS